MRSNESTAFKRYCAPRDSTPAVRWRPCAAARAVLPWLCRRGNESVATAGGGFNNCHRTTPELLAAVSRGVLTAGGLPLEFPTISLGEPFLSPTSLVFRNLMAMDVEEMIRAQPMDSGVLIGGCDKTLPAQLMGAISAGKPAISLVVGPMMTGSLAGTRPAAPTTRGSRCTGRVATG